MPKCGECDQPAVISYDTGSYYQPCCLKHAPDDMIDMLERYGWSRSQVEAGSTFTKEEREVLDAAVYLWNKFLQLPQQHEDDTTDFRHAIHTIQRIIGYRPVMRKGYLHD